MYDLVLNEDELAEDIINVLREKTDGSLANCIQAAKEVMLSLSKFVKEENFVKIQEAVDSYMVNASSSYDGRSLNIIIHDIIDELTQKADYNYSYTENDSIILQLIQLLQNFVSKTDPKIPASIISDGDFQLLGGLIELYQMDQNTELRLEALKAIQCICVYCENLKNYVLDSTLSSTVVQNFTFRDQPLESMQLIGMDILTRLYSIDKTPPLGHFDYVNAEFCIKILRLLQYHPADLMDFLVAFNNITPAEVDNPVVEAISSNISPMFGEIYIQRLNKRPTESKVKLLVSLCQGDATNLHDIFYDNDLEVLCNILSRELRDTDDDKLRVICFKCIKMLHSLGVTNTAFSDAVRNSSLDESAKKEFLQLMNN